MTLNLELQEQIHSLWDSLADIDAAHVDDAANLLMDGACQLVNAQNAVWIGSVRLDNTLPNDPVKGWRSPIIRFLRPTKPLDDKAKEQVKDLYNGVADETTIANVAGAGRFRVNRLRDIVPEEWFQSRYYTYFYHAAGHADAIYAAFPVNTDAESWFGIFRSPDFPPFSVEERDLFGYIIRGIKWFHRQLMLSHGLLIAREPLTPAERRVLQILLTSLPEKEIGPSMGITSNSAHQYVVNIFRKFGVNSRAALVSLWLGA